MSKKALHKTIKENGGYIFSDGTLNMLHLLGKAADFIMTWNLKQSKNKRYVKPLETYRDIVNVFQETDQAPDGTLQQLKERKSGLWYHIYYGNIELKPDSEQDYAAYHVWDDFEALCQQVAPEGYYFGASEGDGACIGFFKWEEEHRTKSD